jgi:hypothetical protein
MTTPKAKKSAETANVDVETLTSATESDELTLTSGSVVRVHRIRTRETFALLKILTRGVGPILGELSFDRDDPEAFAGQMISLVVLAIPDAEDETIEFLQRMVSPVNPADNDRVTEELSNPELEDTIAIIEKVIRNESSHMLALGKRLAALFGTKTAEISAK